MYVIAIVVYICVCVNTCVCMYVCMYIYDYMYNISDVWVVQCTCMVCSVLALDLVPAHCTSLYFKHSALYFGSAHCT